MVEAVASTPLTGHNHTRTTNTLGSQSHPSDPSTRNKGMSSTLVLSVTTRTHTGVRPPPPERWQVVVAAEADSREAPERL